MVPVPLGELLRHVVSPCDCCSICSTVCWRSKKECTLPPAIYSMRYPIVSPISCYWPPPVTPPQAFGWPVVSIGAWLYDGQPQQHRFLPHMFARWVQQTEQEISLRGPWPKPPRCGCR